MKTLHILTLNWNGQEKLKKLIPSLNNVVKEIENTNEWKVIWHVRDNGSNDLSVSCIDNFEYEKRIFEMKHNRASFSEGVNFLHKEAAPSASDMLLLLNNDIEFRDGSSVLKMLDLQKKTQSDIVGARLLFSNTTKLQHAGVIFSHRYNLMPYHFRPGEESDENAKKNRWFQAVTAACCLVREDTFRNIEGMDEGFKWAFDDIDMCLKTRAIGGKVAYCGETEIWHEESASLKKNPVNKMFMNSNVERFRKKWNGKYEVDHEMYLGNPSFREIK